MQNEYSKTKPPVTCLYFSPTTQLTDGDDTPDLIASVAGILSFRNTTYAYNRGNTVSRRTHVSLKKDSNIEESEIAWTNISREQLNDQLRRFSNGKRFIELTSDITGESVYVQIDNIKNVAPYIPDRKMAIIDYHHPDLASPVRVREAPLTIFHKISQELADFPTTAPASVFSESATPPKPDGNEGRDELQLDIAFSRGVKRTNEKNNEPHFDPKHPDIDINLQALEEAARVDRAERARQRELQRKRDRDFGLER